MKDSRKVWLEEYGPLHKHRIAEHFGIYEHLFGGSFFYPVVNLEVAYDIDNEFVTPVYYGNVISPTDVNFNFL